MPSNEGARITLISVVVPVLNEQDAIGPFLERVVPIAEGLLAPYGPEVDFEILFVDDGSTDATALALRRAHHADRRVRSVRLSRNFGKDTALGAGLDHARGRAVIPIDVDLQDPPEVIPEMVGLWLEGYEVVDVVRADRRSDGWLKRSTAALYYRLHNLIADQPIPPNVGDFRLLDRKVVEAVKRMPERARVMKCLFAWVGFQRTEIHVRRAARGTGSSKWKYWRLWNFALDGITSSSTVPLRVWTYFGVAIAASTLLYAAFLLIRTLVHGVDVPGYASIMVAVLFFGGVNMLSLGVIGEYLGRTYQETKRRPLYVVADRIGVGAADDWSRSVEPEIPWAGRAMPGMTATDADPPVSPRAAPPALATSAGSRASGTGPLS